MATGDFREREDPVPPVEGDQRTRERPKERKGVALRKKEREGKITTSGVRTRKRRKRGESDTLLQVMGLTVKV